MPAAVGDQRGIFPAQAASVLRCPFGYLWLANPIGPGPKGLAALGVGTTTVGARREAVRLIF